MRSLREDIYVKTNEIKTKIKTLHNIFNELYNIERKNKSKSIFAVRRSAAKIKNAYEKINSLEVKNNKDKKITAFDRDILDLHKATLKNLKLLEEYYISKEIEARRFEDSKEIFDLRKNIDSLVSAQNDIKRLDTNMSISRERWEELSNKL
jgi:hypothetical protein